MGVLLSHYPPLVLRQGLSLLLGTCQLDCVEWSLSPRDFPIPTTLVLGLHVCTTKYGFVHGFWELISGPRVVQQTPRPHLSLYVFLTF